MSDSKLSKKKVVLDSDSDNSSEAPLDQNPNDRGSTGNESLVSLHLFYYITYIGNSH